MTQLEPSLDKDTICLPRRLIEIWWSKEWDIVARVCEEDRHLPFGGCMLACRQESKRQQIIKNKKRDQRLSWPGISAWELGPMWVLAGSRHQQLWSLHMASYRLQSPRTPLPCIFLLFFFFWKTCTFWILSTKYFLLVWLETRRLSLLSQMKEDGICLMFFFPNPKHWLKYRKLACELKFGEEWGC